MINTHEDFDDGRPAAEMACIAPPDYWRRQPRSALTARWWEWPLAVIYLTGAVTIIVTMWALAQESAP